MLSGHEDTFYDANVDRLLECGLGLWGPTEKQGTEDKYLSDDYAMRLEDIALEIGISRQRAHQLLNSALKKCAKWARAHGYRLEDLLPDPRPEANRHHYSSE
jgi:hypothetical protein